MVFSARFALLTIWVVALAAGGCGDCSRKPVPRPDVRKIQPAVSLSDAGSPPAGERQVVLVVVDALRADRLGCYGYREQPTTPAIDRLASQGIVFEAAHAAAPWTGPSFGSLLTGVSPTVHGAGRRARKDDEGSGRVGSLWMTSISESTPILPELIGDLPSAGFATNGFLHPKLGYGRGFDRYDHENGSLNGSRRAAEVTELALEWIREHAGGPFFVMIHYLDPHISYDPPGDYRERFAPGDPPGQVEVPFTDVGRARSGELGPDEAESRYIIGLYNGEVRYVDDQIGRLVGELGELGLLETAWLAVTSDHGEEHFDHGSFEHGHRYEEEVTRVPLVVRPPGGEWRAGERVEQSVRHVDVPPTVLEWLGVEPPDHFEGGSLMPLASGEQRRDRPAYMEYNLYWKPRTALFDGRFKLIRDVDGDQSDLFDLREDPGERRDLGEDHPRFDELARALESRRELLEKAARSKGEAESVELPEALESALRSLGYVE